ncbi:MAG: hypothetical protein HC915_01130 [Anaerolineae bacterium]|nr:hypothetical protein [Anaerolineae bacterium]
MPIQVLPDTVASQIAAGEVIERPASAVKELIENALDAKAQHIRVEIQGAGLEQLTVSDDGDGIMAEEMSLALVRHATSKLRQIEDLDRLQTLGFRGEALASLAAVSHLTLTSRHHQASQGRQISVRGGKIVHEQAAGIPPGTQVAVHQLFYNVPARRKFLKSETTERRHVVNLVSHYAMAYPAVRFSLAVDGREALRTTGSGNCMMSWWMYWASNSSERWWLSIPCRINDLI